MRAKLALAAVFLLLVSMCLIAVLSSCNKDVEETPSAAVEEETSESTPTGPERVTIGQVKQWIDRGDTIVLVDARSTKSWTSATTKAAGAFRVSPSDIAQTKSMVPHGKTVVAYCT